MKSTYNHINIQDLTSADILAIRDLAINKTINEVKFNCPHKAMISATLDFIYSKGCQIVKDETREATWSTPKKSWNLPEQPKRKNWWKE